MEHLKLIIIREFLAKVRNRSFIVMTILSPLLIVGMVALVVFLSKMNSDDKKLITILDESHLFLPEFEQSESLSFIHFRNIDMAQAKDSSESMGTSGFLFIPQGADVDEISKNIQLYSSSSPSVSLLNNIERRIERKVREIKLNDLGVNNQQLAAIEQSFEINTSSFSGKRNLKGINELKAVIGGAFGYLIMMFIIIYGSFVMRSVIEEKTSRIIEVIISSVNPFQLMLGKIIGTAFAGVLQFIIWIFSAGILGLIFFSIIGIDISELTATTNLSPSSTEVMNLAATDADKLELYAREFFEIPWVILLSLFIVYFVLGYLIYSAVYAAIGSAVDNETDTQQFMFPVIMPLILAVYVGGFSVFDNPHGPIAVGFSMFPLTSPIVMLMRIPSGGVPWWQIVISILLLIATFLFIVWLAAKIYRIGILMYGKKASYKELYKWLKY
jgi:ABC-2 type transport system permease protein